MHAARGRTRAIALILVLSAAAPWQASAERAAPLDRISISNFGRISDVYFRGAQPKGGDYADLAALGVKTVIDLADAQAGEAQAVQAAGLTFFRIPLTTSAAPPAAAVRQFLAIVNDPANQPVYVHCKGGRHRTGIMTAVYRMTHDHWTPDRAFAEMVQFQFKTGLVSHDALERFVYGFPSRMAGAFAVSGADAARR